MFLNRDGCRSISTRNEDPNIYLKGSETMSYSKMSDAETDCHTWSRLVHRFSSNFHSHVFQPSLDIPKRAKSYCMQILSGLIWYSDITWQVFGSTSYIRLSSSPTYGSLKRLLINILYRSGTHYSKEGPQASHSDLQYMGSWAGPDRQSIDVTLGGSVNHHTAQNIHPQPDESEASPPDQTQIDGHVPSERYPKQTVRDEPWNSLHVQQKQT